jgi:hypothetical protein
MDTTQRWYAQGLFFRCTGCGHCCSGYPGYVYLSEQDVDSIAGFLGLDKTRFLRRYTRLVRVFGEQRLSLLEKQPFDCVFWNGSCTVYPVRPYQCRSFPFWKQNVASPHHWERAGATCPGIGRGDVHTPQVIESWLKKVPCYDVRRFSSLKLVYRAHRRQFRHSAESR